MKKGPKKVIEKKAFDLDAFLEDEGLVSEPGCHYLKHGMIH